MVRKAFDLCIMKSAKVLILFFHENQKPTFRKWHLFQHYLFGLLQLLLLWKYCSSVFDENTNNESMLHCDSDEILIILSVTKDLRKQLLKRVIFK